MQHAVMLCLPPGLSPFDDLCFCRALRPAFLPALCGCMAATISYAGCLHQNSRGGSSRTSAPDLPGCEAHTPCSSAAARSLSRDDQTLHSRQPHIWTRRECACCLGHLITSVTVYSGRTAFRCLPVSCSGCREAYVIPYVTFALNSVRRLSSWILVKWGRGIAEYDASTAGSQGAARAGSRARFAISFRRCCACVVNLRAQGCVGRKDPTRAGAVMSNALRIDSASTNLVRVGSQVGCRKPGKTTVALLCSNSQHSYDSLLVSPNTGCLSSSCVYFC